MNRRGFLSFLGLAPVAAPLIVASQARALPLIQGEAPASGTRTPNKQEMREWMASIERAIGLVSQQEAKACQRRFQASRGQEGQWPRTADNPPYRPLTLT